MFLGENEMKKFLVVTAILLTFSSSALLAASSKPANLQIATVNAEQILSQSPKVKAVNDQLRQKFKSQAEQLQQQQKNLQTEQTALKKNEVTMQAADIKKAQQKISDNYQTFTTDRQQFQAALNKAKQLAMSKLLTRLQTDVATIAKKKHYALVLPSSSLAYADNTQIEDMTAVVQRLFDAPAKKPAK